MRVPTARSAPNSVAPDRPRAATTICSKDAVTAFVERKYGATVELRYSPHCWAAWAKMSRTSPGDRILITPEKGNTKEYRQRTGHDAQTPMVPVTRPQDAQETIAPGMPRGLPSGHTVPRHTIRRPPNRQRDNALRGDAHPCQNSCAIAIMARAAAPGVRSDGAARKTATPGRRRRRSAWRRRPVPWRGRPVAAAPRPGRFGRRPRRW